ncbi:hypothetical protein NDU88_004906, partial [Pleurodeles waltl]
GLEDSFLISTDRLLTAGTQLPVKEIHTSGDVPSHLGDWLSGTHLPWLHSI